MITVFGSINVDLVSRVERIPRPGETVRGSDYRLIPGGKGANQALAARRAGAGVRLIGAIGDDELARVALGELAAAGVDLDGVRRRHGTTGVAIITVDDNGENSIVLSPGANATVRADALQSTPPGRADTLLLQLEVPLEETLAAARIARAGGVRVVLSVAPFQALLPDQLADVSIIVVNEHEAADLAAHLGIAGGDAERIVAGLAARLGRTVIATLGADGAIAADGTRLIRVPALPVTPVDTTGAGDTFSGVLAAVLDQGADLETAMSHAAIAGSLACLKEGAQPSFPTRTEIDAALAKAQGA
jgi:ribokinase